MLEKAAPPVDNDATWPLLADVPFKPSDFSPKPVYDHYMNELEYHRAEGETAKEKAEANDPSVPDDAALASTPKE